MSHTMRYRLIAEVMEAKSKLDGAAPPPEYQQQLQNMPAYKLSEEAILAENALALNMRNRIYDHTQEEIEEIKKNRLKKGMKKKEPKDGSVS